MRKGLAFEYIVKIMILLVVAAVVFNIIFFFSSDIKKAVSEKLFGEKKKMETLEKESGSFSTSQVKNYVKSCWLKTGSDHRQNEICFILKGNVSSVDKNKLKSVKGPGEVDVSEFDKSKNITFVKFKDLGNVVKLES